MLTAPKIMFDKETLDEGDTVVYLSQTGRTALVYSGSSLIFYLPPDCNVREVGLAMRAYRAGLEQGEQKGRLDLARDLRKLIDGE